MNVWTYRGRRYSKWLSWRLTTTHRSHQGNRKNIINKGTHNPTNKNLNVPCEIKCWQHPCHRIQKEEKKGEEGGGWWTEDGACLQQSEDTWCSKVQNWFPLGKYWQRHSKKRKTVKDSGDPALSAPQDVWLKINVMWSNQNNRLVCPNNSGLSF